MPKDENIAPETEVVSETPVEGSQSEFDFEKSDNLSQIREYAKGLKADLQKYKPSSEFIESSFGDLENAKLASSIYTGFAGDEFDPEKFLDVISQLSPSRANQLKESLTKKEAAQLAQAEIEKMFGGKVSKEDVEFFKKFKESGYGLGIEDDIPEALKFDAEGNPKSEEEIEFLRNLQKQVKESQHYRNQEAETKLTQQQQEQQAKIQEAVGQFSSDRINVLNNEFDALGLNPAPTDTADQRLEKEAIKSFVIDGVSGLFLKDAAGAKDYNAALQHIQNGEYLLARRYETRIDAKLLEIFRSKPVTRLLQSLTKVESDDKEERPEISNSGASQDTTPSGKTPTANDIFDSLVKAGKISV